MIWYLTEQTFEGNIVAIKTVESEKADVDENSGEKTYYFREEDKVTIWESKDSLGSDNDTPYYEENIFADNSQGHRRLITEIFTNTRRK